MLTKTPHTGDLSKRSNQMLRKLICVLLSIFHVRANFKFSLLNAVFQPSSSLYIGCCVAQCDVGCFKFTSSECASTEI